MPQIASVCCPSCNVLHRVEVQGDECGAYAVLDTVPCQGAAPDSCNRRLCEDCKIECSLCGLYACEEHIGFLGKDRACHNCIALMVADGAEELTECDQETAATISVLASAGVTSAEVRAVLELRGRMVN